MATVNCMLKDALVVMVAASHFDAHKPWFEFVARLHPVSGQGVRFECDTSHGCHPNLSSAAPMVDTNQLTTPGAGAKECSRAR